MRRFPGIAVTEFRMDCDSNVTPPVLSLLRPCLLINPTPRSIVAETSPITPMHRQFLQGAIAASLIFNATLQAAPVMLNGSGATFPAPLYMRWASDFKKSNPDITVNYQGVGSGAGVKQFTDGITDFGASDVAMSDSEIAKASDNVLMLPATAGTIVLAYNLPGVPAGLKLSREAVAGILLGTVKVWNNPLIVKANPGVNLPATPVTLFHGRTVAVRRLFSRPTSRRSAPISPPRSEVASRSPGPSGSPARETTA